MTIGLMLTGRFVFQYLGWGVAAAATPCIMALTGSAFFGMSLAAQYGTHLTFGPYTLAAAGVVAGGVTQVCCITHIHHCAPCMYTAATCLADGIINCGHKCGIYNIKRLVDCVWSATQAPASKAQF